MANIGSIADFTYSMAVNRFKKVVTREFEIKGRKFHTVDVLDVVRKSGNEKAGRTQPDRYVFDGDGNFVSRNVNVQTRSGGTKSIVTKPALDGFETVVIKKNNLGEYGGDKLIVTNNSDYGELVGDNGQVGIRGFISKLFARLKPSGVDSHTPVNIKINDWANPAKGEGQKFAIRATAKNGNVLIKGNENILQVVAREDGQKLPVLTELFEAPGKMQTGDDIARYLEDPLLKLKSFE